MLELADNKLSGASLKALVACKKLSFLALGGNEKIKLDVRAASGWNANDASDRLVLGWIDSYDSNQILIFSGFSRSTKLSG